jgi:hypothetical protein
MKKVVAIVAAGVVIISAISFFIFKPFRKGKK